MRGTVDSRQKLCLRARHACTFLYAAGVLGSKILPAAIVPVARFGSAHLQEMAVGSAQGIGGIHVFRHLVFPDVEHALQHRRHLLLGSLTLSGNRHLDFQRSILVYWYIVVDGSSDSHSLRPAELEHRLHILAEEGSLYRHLVGQIGVDDASHPLENPAESQVGIFLLAHVDDASWFYAAGITAYLGRFTLQGYVDNGNRFLEGESKSYNGAYSVVKASHAWRNWQFSLSWANPLNNNYKAYENELLNRNLYKHTIGYSKWMGNLVSLNISWRLSKGSKHNSAEKRINLRDTDNGIIK